MVRGRGIRPIGAAAASVRAPVQSRGTLNLPFLSAKEQLNFEEPLHDTLTANSIIQESVTSSGTQEVSRWRTRQGYFDLPTADQMA